MPLRDKLPGRPSFIHSAHLTERPRRAQPRRGRRCPRPGTNRGSLARTPGAAAAPPPRPAVPVVTRASPGSGSPGSSAGAGVRAPEAQAAAAGLAARPAPRRRFPSRCGRTRGRWGGGAGGRSGGEQGSPGGGVRSGGAGPPSRGRPSPVPPPDLCRPLTRATLAPTRFQVRLPLTEGLPDASPAPRTSHAVSVSPGASPRPHQVRWGASKPEARGSPSPPPSLWSAPAGVLPRTRCRPSSLLCSLFVYGL